MYQRAPQSRPASTDAERRRAAGPGLVDHSPRGAALRAAAHLAQHGPAAQAHRKVLQGLFGGALSSTARPPGASNPVQMEERQTTLYSRNQQVWHKNMQIIDSTSADDYVHLSRSTTTDPQQFPQNNPPPNSNVVPNDVNKRERVELGPNAAHNFPRGNFSLANNAHVTLEGRYMTVMHNLATNRYDNTIAVKAGPPVVNYTNLNFGDVTNTPQLSNYSIQGWIDLAADEAEDHLRFNTPGDMQDGSRSPARDDEINDAADVIVRVRDSTKAFANRLISTTPALQTLETNDLLLHYAGAPWIIRF